MIRKIKFTSIPVHDQDRALDFYVNVLGFTLVTDQPMGPGQRWIELRPAKGDAGIALFTPPGHESRVGTSREYPWSATTWKRRMTSYVRRVLSFSSGPSGSHGVWRPL